MHDDDPTVLMPTFAPGAFFADRYRIDALLGSGAMGRVYAASEVNGERRVALKVLHVERLGEEETVARFSREAEVLASIGHPCIVEVYAFHRTSDGVPYLAMELLEGVTLKKRLTSAGRFEDPRDFQEILDCVAGALSVAHERGVVHRDMKPDNVFLPATGEPRAKLVDFGLSRMAAQDKTLTHRGMLLGTPRYMAPEQIRNAAEAGPSVDLYSLGVLLYESLSGQSPYPAEDYGQLLGCVLESRVTPFEHVRPDLAPALAEVVGRAMHPDPAQRFATAVELADAYGAAIGSPSRLERISQTPRRPARRITSNQSLVANKGSTLAFEFSSMERQEAPAPLAGEGWGGGPPVSVARSVSPPPDPLPGGELLAKGGDTVFMPSVHGAAPPMAMTPPASYAAPAPPPPKRGRGVLLFLIALVVVVVLSAAAGLGLRAWQEGAFSIPGLTD